MTPAISVLNVSLLSPAFSSEPSMTTFFVSLSSNFSSPDCLPLSV